MIRLYLREKIRKNLICIKRINLLGGGKFILLLNKDKSTDEIIRSLLDLINANCFIKDFVCYDINLKNINIH